MELVMGDEKAYVLAGQLSTEQAKERAWDAKGDVFGNVSRLLFRPKGEEIQIVYSERRLEPFWFIGTRCEAIYERRARFTVPVPSPNVVRVTLDGMAEPIALGGKGNFVLSGVEHCHEDVTKEHFFDAVTGQPFAGKPYLAQVGDEVDLATFAPEGTLVVAPEVRASSVVRQVLGETMKALQADVIHKDLVEINPITLYLRPVYAFEYHWLAKDRRAIVEIDGVTGELRAGGKAVRANLGKMITPELLFDVGIDAVDLLVPGGGIALKVGRAIARHQAAREGAS